jgi:methylglutaconyl-CoA hydratase
VVVLRKIAPAIAMEMMLTGEAFDAARARDVGLLNTAVPTGMLDATVADHASKLLLAGPEAMAATKGLVRDVPGLSMADGFERMAALSADRFASAEGLEGMTAFAEKRAPNWAVGSGL